MSSTEHRDERETTAAGRRSFPAAVPTIGGRTATEEELLEGEHRLRTVASSEFLPILFHREGTILDANDAAQRLFGYPREELLRQNLFDLVAVQDRERAQAYAAAHAQHPYELLGVRKDGGLLHLDVEARDIDLDGLPARVVFVRDADARHQTEAERRRVDEQYRQAQKLEALGQLAGGIAHSFNNLLAAIVGYSELLLAKLPPDSELRPEAEEIARAAERATEVTRGLLLFSRREPAQRRLVDLNEVVGRTGALLGQLIRREVEIVVRLAPELPLVAGDPAQIEQVVINLAVNARDAMPAGGTLSIETGESEVDQLPIHLSLAPGRYVTLTVGDTGVGMDEATRERIFEPFFTTKKPGEGTGLGLSTVLGIVEEAGGRIAVESRPGEGATFTVALPAAG